MYLFASVFHHLFFFLIKQVIYVIGDEILQVNDISLAGVTHQNAVSMFKVSFFCMFSGIRESIFWGKLSY